MKRRPSFYARIKRAYGRHRYLGRRSIEIRPFPFVITYEALDKALSRPPPRRFLTPPL